MQTDPLKLKIQANETYNYINNSLNRERMGFAAKTMQGDWFENVFGPSLGAFETAVAAWEEPLTRTPVLTTAVRQKQKLFVPVYRKLYTGFLKNSPLVTNEDLIDMGLPERPSGGGHPSTPPDTYPLPRTIILDVPRRVHLNIVDSKAGEHEKAKPPGVHGAELRGRVFDVKPAVVTFEDLTESYFDTHTPFVIDFKEEERGKLFYYALRWETTRGAKGPFGPIAVVQIP